MRARRTFLLRAGAALAALAGAGSATARDAAPVVLAPETNWTADFGDDHCALRRNFTGAPGTVFLELKVRAPGEAPERTVASRDIASRRRPPKSAFLPDDEVTEAALYTHTTTDQGWSGFTWRAAYARSDRGDGEHPPLLDKVTVEPALDRDGVPVASFYDLKIVTVRTSTTTMLR